MPIDIGSQSITAKAYSIAAVVTIYCGTARGSKALRKDCLIMSNIVPITDGTSLIFYLVSVVNMVLVTEKNANSTQVLAVSKQTWGF